MGWSTVLVPNAVMMINHARGGSPAVFNFVIKHCGYYGLFALPFVGLTMEKSFYDTAVRVPACDVLFCAGAEEQIFCFRTEGVVHSDTKLARTDVVKGHRSHQKGLGPRGRGLSKWRSCFAVSIPCPGARFRYTMDHFS